MKPIEKPIKKRMKTHMKTKLKTRIKSEKKKKINKETIAKILVFTGIFIVILPSIMKIITTNQMNSKIDNFAEIVSEKIEKEDNGDRENTIDELYNKMKEYNENLYKNGQILNDMLAYQKTDFDLIRYGFKENIIGTINIPKINIQLPIYLGATKENLNKGATHLSQTSLPLGEINSNVVIAAHRGLIRHPMFRNLHKLEMGDTITITNFWETLEYKVVNIKIIEPTDSSNILIQEGRDLVTLVTCHPYRINTHRYIVYCERV